MMPNYADYLQWVQQQNMMQNPVTQGGQPIVAFVANKTAADLFNVNPGQEAVLIDMDMPYVYRKDNPSYGHGGMWTAEGSYGRMPYGRRDGDGDGRYNESYRGYDGYGNRGYGESYGDYGNRGSYGRMYGHNEDIVEKLRRDMRNASNDQERDYIRKLIRQYEE